MNWRRAATRYGQTPAPATPYQRAEQLWDERIGSARVQAANWRLMAFGALALAAVAMGDDIRARSRSSVTPYVVEVDRTGAANAIAPAVTEYQPSDAQIGYFLARFVQNTRALSVDPIVVRQAWLDAYDQITSHAKPVLDDYARQVDPFGKVGHRAVTADVTSVVRASDKSFRIAWIEHAYEEGAAIPAERWSAILTVITQTPRTEERLRKNPLGIYIRRNCLVTGAGRQWMRHTIALGVAAVLPLAACAPEIPQISYDDPAALHTEPPKPVKIVQMPELLPLPGQLKRMPRGAGSTSASEPRDPARRVQLANAAASVKPTRAGYVNAIQVYPYSDGALYQLYVAPVHVTDIALEPGEELKAVAAGDTTLEDRGHRERVGGHPSSSRAGQAGLRRPADEQHRHRDGPADLSYRSASDPGDLYGRGLLALSAGRVRGAAATECRGRGTRQRRGGGRHRCNIAPLPLPDQRRFSTLAAGPGL